jgi:hypothetical protein
MTKIKFALFKDSYALPDVSVMKKVLSVKKISSSKSFQNKTADWIGIENKEDFAFFVTCDVGKLLDIHLDYTPELYAFSDDANSTFLSLHYADNIINFFEADEADLQKYIDAHFERNALRQLYARYENDEYIDRVISEYTFSKSQVAKFNAFKLIDKKQRDFINKVCEPYTNKMKLIVSNGWS